MERRAYERAAGDAAEFTFISTLDVERSWDTPASIVEGYDGVIIGGSSDFFLHGGLGEEEVGRAGAREVLDRVRDLVQYLVERQVPTLGICFGHQLIAEVFGGAVTHDHEQKKAGTHEVQLNQSAETDPLLKDFGTSFDAQYAHRDSVTRPPSGAVVLGNGSACRFSALRYGNTCYTFQFHPELVAQDFLSEPESLAPYLLPGKQVADIVRETPAANGLVRTFVERIATS